MGQLVDLGDVHVWLDDHGGPGGTNSGVIVDEDGVTMVDAQLSPSRAADVNRAVESFGRPIRRLVVTSSHIPYVGGSSMFSLAAVYGTAQISAHLDQPANLDTCKAMYPDAAVEIDEITEVGCRRVTHTVDEGAWLTPRVVVAPLPGELDENLIVQVPESQIVFAGALCSFGVVPMAGAGDPGAWADALDTVAGWGEIFIPGHGPIGGREELASLQAYLRACVDAAGDVARLADGPWDSWSGQAYHQINVDRAASLAAGDPSPPRSLLAMMGLSELPS